MWGFMGDAVLVCLSSSSTAVGLLLVLLLDASNAPCTADLQKKNLLADLQQHYAQSCRCALCAAGLHVVGMQECMLCWTRAACQPALLVSESVRSRGRADTALAEASAVLRGLSETPALRPPHAPDATAYGAPASTPPPHATQRAAASAGAGGPGDELTASAESEAALAALLASAAARSHCGGTPAGHAGSGLQGLYPGPHAAAMADAASVDEGHASTGPRDDSRPGSEAASADLPASPAEPPHGTASAASAAGSGSEAAWEDLLPSLAAARAGREFHAARPGLQAAESGSEAAFSELLASPTAARRGSLPGAAGQGACGAGSGAEAASAELLASPAGPRHRGRSDASAAEASGSDAGFAELLAPRGFAGAASTPGPETQFPASSCGSPVDVEGSSMAATGRGPQTLHEDSGFRGSVDACERDRRRSGAALVVQQPAALAAGNPAVPQPPVVPLALAAPLSGGAHTQRAHGDALAGHGEPDVNGGLAAAHGQGCQAAHGAAAAARRRQEEESVSEAWEQTPLAAAAAELLAAVRTAPGLQPTPAHAGTPQARPGATRGPAQQQPMPDVQLAAGPVHDMELHGWDAQQQSRDSADAPVSAGVSAQWPAAAQAAAQTPDQAAHAAENLLSSPGAQASVAADAAAINVPLATGAAQTLSEPTSASAPPAAGAVPADQAAGAAKTLAGFPGAAAAAGNATLAADLADGAALAARFAAGSRRMQREMAALRASLESMGAGGGPQRGSHARSLLEAPAEERLSTATASASASPDLGTCAGAAPTAGAGTDARTPGGEAVLGAQQAEPGAHGPPRSSGAAPAPSADDGSLAAFLSGADALSKRSRSPAQPHTATRPCMSCQVHYCLSHVLGLSSAADFVRRV